jgi:Protein of unknown function (DUF3592)
MSSLAIPVELNQPLPRRVTSTSSFKAVVAVLAMFPCVGFLMLGTMYAIHHNRATLRANGVLVVGEITGLRMERSKSTYSYRVSYQFTPSSTSDGRQVAEIGEDGVSEARYRTLQVGQVAPLLYEPARPSNSGLNFDDSVNTSDDSAMMLLFAVFIVGLFGGFYALFMTVLLLPYFKEKKLLQWGRVARAVILKEEEIDGRFPTMTATYQFTDEKCQRVTGIQKGLPSVKKFGWPRFREVREAVTKNPIAIYDPNDSGKSMLYRAGSLVCY